MQLHAELIAKQEVDLVSEQSDEGEVCSTFTKADVELNQDNYKKEKIAEKKADPAYKGEFDDQSEIEEAVFLTSAQYHALESDLGPQLVIKDDQSGITDRTDPHKIGPSQFVSDSRMYCPNSVYVHSWRTAVTDSKTLMAIAPNKRGGS